MEAATDLFDTVRDALGGGNLTLWLVVGGLVVAWLAIRAVKMAVRFVLLLVAAGLFLGTAPWASEPTDAPATECVITQVGAATGGWRTNVTKRVTVTELSPDAQCAPDGTRLAAGRAVARLRTFYDVPFDTAEVTPDAVTFGLAVP